MKTGQSLFLALTIVLTVSVPSTLVMAAEDTAGDHADSTRWMVELPVWIPGFRGAISWGELDIIGGEGDQGNGDSNGILDKILDSHTKLDYYFVGKVRYSYQKWRLQGDIFGGRIDNSVKFILSDGTPMDTKLTVIIPRVIVEYQILNKSFGNPKAGEISSYLYAGGRLFNVNLFSVYPRQYEPVELNTTWIDPVAGISLFYSRKKLTLSSQGDMKVINPFSHPTWWFHFHARYRFYPHFSFALGWVIQDIHRVSEVLDRDFIYKAHLSGPMAGLTIHL